MNEWRTDWYGGSSPAGGVSEEGESLPPDVMKSGATTDGMEHGVESAWPTWSVNIVQPRARHQPPRPTSRGSGATVISHADAKRCYF